MGFFCDVSTVSKGRVSQRARRRLECLADGGARGWTYAHCRGIELEYFLENWCGATVSSVFLFFVSGLLRSWLYARFGHRLIFQCPETSLSIFGVPLLWLSTAYSDHSKKYTTRCCCAFWGIPHGSYIYIYSTGKFNSIRTGETLKSFRDAFMAQMMFISKLKFWVQEF